MALTWRKEKGDMTELQPLNYTIFRRIYDTFVALNLILRYKMHESTVMQ